MTLLKDVVVSDTIIKNNGIRTSAVKTAIGHYIVMENIESKRAIAIKPISKKTYVGMVEALTYS